MRKFSLFVLICLLVGCSQPDKAKEKLALSDGGSVSLAQLSGKWLVVSYWDSWHKGCGPTMAVLNRLSRMAPKQVQVYAYNYMDLHGDELRHAIKAVHVQVPSFKYLPADWLGLPAEVEQLPATFILDPKGNLVASLYGKARLSDLERYIKAV